MTAAATRPTTIKIDQDTRERVQRLADARQRTSHTNGLHVTSEEADDWLAKLEAGQDAEPPECHV
jgi:predicted transcriptional regulator